MYPREVEAQQARSRAEGRLARVVGSAPIVLFALDRDAKVTFVDRVPNTTIDKPFDAKTLLGGVRRLVG